MIESADTPLRIAVLGLGLAGRTMIDAIHSHPGYQLIAGADVDPELRRKFVTNESLPAFNDLSSLVKHRGVEALYIATPHQFHREHAVHAFEAGCHVILEKPMALSMEDCDAIVAACRAANRELIVGYTHGFDPAIMIMRDAIASGKIGKLGFISSSNYTNFLYRPRRADELDPRSGGGIMMNQVPHQVDMIRALVQAPITSVRASSTALDPARAVEGSCAALLFFENGVTASIVYSGYDGFDTDIWHDLISETGRHKQLQIGSGRRRVATLSREDESAMRRDALGYGSGAAHPPPSAGPHFGTLIVTGQHGDLRHGPQGVEIYGRSGIELLPAPQSSWLPGWGDTLESLRQSVRNGVPCSFDATFGRDTVAACMAIAESARAGREITLTK